MRKATIIIGIITLSLIVLAGLSRLMMKIEGDEVATVFDLPRIAQEEGQPMTPEEEDQNFYRAMGVAQEAILYDNWSVLLGFLGAIFIVVFCVMSLVTSFTRPANRAAR